MWETVVVSSGASGAGSRFSSLSGKASRLECSEDCCSDSSGIGVLLLSQGILGILGQSGPWGVREFEILTAYAMIAVKVL